MYIKQIIIQGFKSYKEQTVIEPFSPKTNVIVGRNGSGKSNFFAAIRFVLSDAYTQMGREERQALLHEGSGSAVMSAYVEIIFDNSDDRFPTGKDELILRRTIGLKKDEYSLDRKSATKQDVMNLLESAGFSRSNPYYIVPQGRVTTLTNMKDAERLNLLKEVAGTQVYEARRAESLKIMTETNNKRAKIDELMEYIKTRLNELEGEKDELRQYQEKDKDRRCLEYAYYAREQELLTNTMDEIDQMRADGIENTDDQREEFKRGEKAIAELDAEMKQLTRQLDLLKLARRQLEEDRRETSREQAKVELDVKNLSNGLAASEQARKQHQQDLKAIKQEMAAKEHELAKFLPDYNKLKAKQTEIKNNLDLTENSRTRLHYKQGRGTQFKSKNERDKWLANEIEGLNGTLGEQKANRINAEEEVKAVQTEIQGLEDEIAGLRKRFEGWGGNRQALSEEVSTAKDALEKLTDERKILRRDDDKMETIVQDARKERQRAEDALSHTMDGMTSQGLKTVRRLKAEKNIAGAYGTIAELFEVSEEYRTAAEQTAGNSLFHYVVDNEKTAEQLVNDLHRQRGGRVTFVPLNQVHFRPIKLPNASDTQSLLSKLTYDKKFEKAMGSVFGKTVVCPTLSIASQYARSHGCDAITPDGDKANKKGAMTGGYLDSRRSRLEAVRAVNKWRDEYDNLRARSDQLRKEIEKKDHEINSAMTELQKMEQKLRQLDDSFEPSRIEQRVKENNLRRHRDQLEALVARRDNIANLQKDCGDKISAYEAELSTDFKKSLSADEERQLEQLNSTAKELSNEWSDISKELRTLENRKQLLENDLRDNLPMRLSQLNSQEISTAGTASGNLKDSQRALQQIQKKAAATEAKLEETEAEIEGGEIKISDLHKEKSRLVERQEEFARVIEKHQKRMERSVAKRALIASSLAETSKNIRDLGVLPEEAFEKYIRTDSKKIQSKLKSVNDALKKYKHVNKKAFEQYNNFTSQRDNLTKRRKELDDSQTSIQELVTVLDQRKDEAIERTFKQVSKEFAQIFERLVPAGRGRLVIQRKTDKRVQEDDSDDEHRESVENYTGVGISVSFNSKHDDQQRIQQLSGGQKSLCALALVFAIQQCDPAPFYLFDEIDANLDAQYRTAVAQMLEEISAQQSAQAGEGEDGNGMSGQFICTTFRPEMLLVADKCYGVTFHNKTSGIDAVSRDEALRFVDGEAPK